MIERLIYSPAGIVLIVVIVHILTSEYRQRRWDKEILKASDNQKEEERMRMERIKLLDEEAKQDKEMAFSLQQEAISVLKEILNELKVKK